MTKSYSNLFILILTLIAATSAFAFGGGGSGRKTTAFTAGVDAIGVHINGKTCPEGQELVDNKCVDKCPTGWKRDISGECTLCADDYFKNSENDCIPCDTKENSIAVASKEDCTCPNRVYFRTKASNPYRCHLAKMLDTYSNCQTATLDETDTEQRGFLPTGTPCETSGVDGLCDNTGMCIPQNATHCESVTGGCPSGWFCNYGGIRSPEVCEKIQPIVATYNGKTYYYNSDADLKSWCRPADGTANCIWGGLA